MTAVPSTVSIGTVRVTGVSAVAMRRFADALPGAIAVALREGAVRPRHASAVEQAAWRIAEAVRAERERQPWG